MTAEAVESKASDFDGITKLSELTELGRFWIAHPSLLMPSIPLIL
jgi:hypothetical protein